MGPLELLEKLINERGSAAILREHIGLLKAEQTALEARCRDAEAKVRQLELSVAEYKSRADQAQQALEALQSGSISVQVCAHCASISLRRTGTRPHPTFGEVGLKEAIFRCNVCERDSFFEIPLN